MVNRATDIMSPITKGTRDVSNVDVIGSSSVLIRMRSRKTALNASPDINSNESEDQFPSESTTNSDELEQLTSVTAMGGGVGEYNREEKLGLEREKANVGDPQSTTLDQPMNITKVLTELQAIQSQGPKNYCILGTRDLSFLHQQIVEML